jgi:hypothetical protein
MDRNNFIKKYAGKLTHIQLAKILGVHTGTVGRRAHEKGVSLALTVTKAAAEKLYPIAKAEWESINPPTVEAKFEVPAEVARINKLWRVTSLERFSGCFTKSFV